MDEQRIWLLSGTGEGPPLAAELLRRGWQLRVSVVSSAAARAYPAHPNLELQVGALGDEAAVQTAFAKGLPKNLVLRRHVLRAGLLPVVTMMGLQFAFMMGGAIVVENIFSWNGLGRMAVEAIFQRDYPIIQGFILTFSVVVVVVSISIDALYAMLDPRIRRA